MNFGELILKLGADAKELIAETGKAVNNILGVGSAAKKAADDVSTSNKKISESLKSMGSKVTGALKGSSVSVKEQTNIQSSSFAQLRNELSNTNSNVTKSLLSAAKAFNPLLEQLRLADKDVGKYNTSMVGLMQNWGGSIGPAAQKFSDSFRQAKDAIKESGMAAGLTDKELTKLTEDMMMEAQKTFELTGAFKDLSSNLWVLSMGLQQLGRSLTTVFTIPIAGIAAIGLKTFADWEQGSKNLQASANLTTSENEAMLASFRELALVMPLTVKEFQDIAVSAAEAGVSKENIEQFAISIGKVVTISKELDAKSVAELVMGISKSFKIAEEDIERVLSTVRQGAKDARGGMDDFINGLLRTLPAAASLKIGFIEMNAILASIIPVSASAERAGTQVTTMFDQMSAKLPELASQMGLTKEALKEMMSTDIVATLMTYIEGLKLSGDEIENNNAVLDIFGRQGARALRLLSDQSDVYYEKLQVLGDAYREGTVLTGDYNIASDTLANTFKRFKNALSEVAYVIGKDLNKIVAPVLEKLVTVVTVLAVAWEKLPTGIKTAIIYMGAFLAIIGPLILMFNSFISVFAGLVTSITRIKGAFGALKTALGIAGKGFGVVMLSMGKFILIAALVVGAIVLIYKALDKLFGIGEKLKNALGITAMQDRFNEVKEKVQASVGEMTSSIKGAFSEMGDIMEKGASNMASVAFQWGDNIMLGLLKGFTEADFGVLNDTLKYFTSYFDILKEQGILTTEGVLNNTLEARRVLAQAISEVKEFGEISADTQRRIESLVGSARSGDIISQILGELQVSKIQETIDKLDGKIKELNESLKEEVDVINDAIDEVKDQYEDQIVAEEDILEILEKQKKDQEKAYKAELKIYEAELKTAQDTLELKKDELEAIKESNDILIENLEEQRDVLKDNVDDAKKALKKLQSLRKDEVDNAKGMVDYAKMNLESAQNLLEREVALGHDEYDASYRAALNRVKVAEQQYDLAYGTYISTQHLYDQEEDLLEDEIELKEEQIDALEDQIDAAEDAAEALEALYQDQVDIAQDTVDAAKEALNDFKDAYAEQKDTLQEEIDVHRERVDDLKDARDDILDTLNDEKDAIEDKYNKEIDILEERVKNAQDSLDNSKKLLENQKSINEQWLAIESERLAAAREQNSNAGDYGGIAAGGILPDIDEEAATKADEEATSKVDEISAWDKKMKQIKRDWNDMWEGLRSDPGIIAMSDELTSWWERVSDSWNIYTNKIKESWSLFWENVKFVFKPAGDWVKKEWEIITNNLKNTWSEKWDSIKNIANGVWTSIGGIVQIGWGIVSGIIETGMGLLSGEWTNTWNGIKNSLSNIWEGIKTTLRGAWEVIEGIIDFSGIKGRIDRIINDVFSWGYDFVNSILKGVRKGIDKVREVGGMVAEAFERFLGFSEPPPEGPLHTADKWGKHFIDMYVGEIRAGIPRIRDAINQIGSLDTLSGVAMPNNNLAMQSAVQGVARPDLSSIASVMNQPASSNKTININPGMMIASRGEVRNFTRMLREYDEFEEGR